MKQNFKTILQGHEEAFSKSFKTDQIHCLELIAREILKALKAGRKLLLCGNGGSAADAQHIAAEFIGRFKRDRKSLAAIALTTDTSILTSIANDYEYKHVFSRQVQGLGAEGDVLIAISTSGNSLNVLEAVNQAKIQRLRTVGFTGSPGGTLAHLADISFKAESSQTPHIQEIHMTALHAISQVVEETLFG